MKETYIVSGHPRSGTSMMMHALITGGLEGAYSSPVLQAVNAAYAPNPNGYFELVKGEQQEAWFPWRFQGKVIKSIYGMLVQLAPGNYKVIFMLRQPEEIRKSVGRLSRKFGKALEDTEYYDKMSRYISIAKLRADMEVLPVSYNDVIENPVGEFKRIASFGLPIDVTKAASVVDKKLYRNRVK